ncbi:MAG: hypothetical protein FGM32_01215 [Candidatus Kapabacteria bacterium]|nr:hypothetical protein [Candidatus Kapabacteria bacterium]
MKITTLLCAITLLVSTEVFAQNYNPLWIPDTIAGSQFNLTMERGVEKWLGPSSAVETAGFNTQQTGRGSWGPTLFVRKGETVTMNVTNNLSDTTAVHWHGFKMSAEMVGGPKQRIAPKSSWKSSWKVTNSAGTYWYRPGLHAKAQEQLLKGLGGMIIVRDDEEAKLDLPRTYGVDDIPLVLSDRAFTAEGQIAVRAYGDSMQVNGVIRAQCNVPGQVVRFRLLNANTERCYFLGFGDNRKFSVIASDGGLLNAPVELTRYFLSPGERIEIVVNFSADKGKSVKLRAFNSFLPQSISGGERTQTGPFVNALARADFDILNVVVGDPTAKPVTAIPTQLAIVPPLKEADAFVNRRITISDSVLATGTPTSYMYNRKFYNPDSIEFKVGLNNTEVWEIGNTGNFSHPLHIHGVQFNILTRNGQASRPEEAGWKDVVFVRNRETVRVIAKFDDFPDSTRAYVFHCQNARHADQGEMGQYVVVDNGNVPTLSFMSTPVRTAREGTPYTYTSRVASNVQSPVTFAVTSGPAGLTINATTGVVTWATPAAGAYDVALAAYMVVNGQNYGAQQTYKLTVTPPLTVTFTSTPVTTGYEGVTYAYAVRARCSDTTRFLSYRMVDSVAGMNLSRQGQLTWAKPALGTYNIAIRATVNGDTVNAVQRYVLTIGSSDATRVTFTTANLPPGTEGKPYSFKVNAMCTDSTKRVELTFRDSVAGMSLTPAGLLEWPAPVIGMHRITIRAKVVGDTLFADQTFNLSIRPDTTTDVAEDQSSSATFRVYPIPASQYVTVETAEPLRDRATISIIDVSGRTVASIPVKAGCAVWSVDTASLPQGSYVIQIDQSARRVRVPLLISR